MKNTFTILVAVLITTTVCAQAPEKMSYQAVVRDASNQLVTNASVGMQISILQGSATGTAVYVERQFPTTNTNGLVSLEIGTGTVVSGDFTTIEWANGPYFIKTETDPAGGNNYSITGTSQLLSVPYALYAKEAANSIQYMPGNGIDISGNTISNTAPDQNVSITGTGATSVSGAYPNFTVSSTDNVDDADADPTNEYQDIQGLSLTGTQLTVGIENGNSQTTDLSSLQDGSWKLNGNNGTTDNSDFIGTTDSVALNFRVNNAKAGRIGTAADGSVFLGYEAGLNDDLSDNRNTFVGYQVGQANTTGQRNTANGYQTLYYNTTGRQNTANGYAALYSNTTGRDNTANGYRALYSNTTGRDNTANGYQALLNNTTGLENTANGMRALYSNTTGRSNTANGYTALYFNTTGRDNTANGYRALYSNTTGDKNTALGYSAFSNGTAYTNSMGLGYNAEPGASNTIRLGNSSVSSIGGHANWTNVSDGRFKKDVQENVGGLDFIMKLRPVTYHLDMDAIARFNNTPDSLRLPESEKLKAAELQVGFIAQEVEAAALETGFDFHGVDKPKNETSHYGLRYAEFVAPLVKGMQEQQQLIEQQQEIINGQEEKIKALESEMKELKALMKKAIEK